jgi:hypothetical protein
VERILEVGERVITARRPGVEVAGHLHGERLVRAFVIETIEEGVKPRLLLQGVRGGWFRGLRLEREMHTRVAAVLLGVAGPDALDLDVEA